MFERFFQVKAVRTLVACGVGAAAFASAQAHAADTTQSSWCSAAKPVKFAEMGWDSAKFMTEVVRYVLEKGYGCKTELMSATNAIALQAITTGDLNVMVEYWAGRTPAYEKAVQDGRVKIVGSLVNGGSVEGYYVPEYVIKGDAARGIKPLAPDLKSVADLPRYKSVFADPEDPSHGRLYNCPIGWQCESDTEQKMKAYKIGAAYTDFHPGSGPALDAAIESAFTRGKPILFYYWEPSTILLLGAVDDPGAVPCRQARRTGVQRSLLEDHQREQGSESVRLGIAADLAARRGVEFSRGFGPGVDVALREGAVLERRTEQHHRAHGDGEGAAASGRGGFPESESVARRAVGAACDRAKSDGQPEVTREAAAMCATA